MSYKPNDFGAVPDQLDRVRLLPWPMFVELIELLGLDSGFFTSAAAPAQRALDVRTQTRAAQVTPLAVEVSLQWVTQAQRKHLKKALELLELNELEAPEGMPDWLSEISGLAEMRSMTMASLRAALNEAKGLPLGKSLDEASEWKGTDDESLEKVMEDESTLLPIFFLDLALERASAVAKIDTPKGSGTGFVIEGNLLVTNAHVFPDLEAARNAKIIFNYQKSANSLDLTPIPIETAPDEKFLVSPADQHDLAVVALAEAAEGRWKEISIEDQSIDKDERVCIIQHPGGDQKHIGMYHNLVTHADENIVQYLTDTLPGSSGAPVFDRNWDLVAIHHAGGWLREPGRKERLFRNEGIAVGHLKALLAQG